MPSKLGEAVLVLKANAKGLQTGLNKAQKATTSRLGKMQASFQGFAKRIPVVGGALAGLATPAGLATAAITGVALALKGAVTRVVNLEKELRPMVERSRIGAEALQALGEAAKRAGSEDGMEAIVDTAQELQLQLGELALTGAARAEEALASLGLQAQELQAMKPEAAWRAVVEEIQKIPNVADRAIAAEEIFGGTSEKLAGIINLTNAEFEALEGSVKATADILSQEGLDSAREFSEASAELKGQFSKIATTVALALLPKLTALIKGLGDIWTAVSPILLPALKALASFMGGTLKGVFETIKGVILVVSGVLTGDFSQAWEGVKLIAVGTLRRIAAVYNNTLGLIPGLAKIDMEKVEESLLGVQESAEDLEPAVEDVTTAMGDAGAQAVDTAEAMGEAEAAEEAHAEAIRESIEAIKNRIAAEQEHLESLGLTKAAVVAAEIALRGLTDAEREGIVTAAGFTGETQAVTLALLSKEQAIREAEAAETAHAEAILKAEEATEAAIEAAKAHTEAIREGIAAIEARMKSDAAQLSSLGLTKAAVVAATIALRALNSAQRQGIVDRAGFTGQTQGETYAGMIKRRREERAEENARLDAAKDEVAARPEADKVARILAPLTFMDRAQTSTGPAGLTFAERMGRFAEGGIALSPMIGMVGEEGPEAIIPLNRLGELGGGMTGEVTLYLDGFEEAVGRANLRQGRRGVE